MKRLYLLILFLFVSIMGLQASGEARLTVIEITRIEYPAFGGAPFGKVGLYEKITGRYRGELNPDNPRNRIIVDLDKASRNERGNVEYGADFYILKPVDLTRGNGTLLYEFANRGNKGLLAYFNSAPSGGNNPSTVESAGSGFLMKRGYTLVWSGFLGDVKEGGNRLTIEVPPALGPNHSPLEGMVWDECNFYADTPACPLSYPVPRLDQSEATLWVRERRPEAPVEVPRGEWQFDGPKSIKLLPEGTPFKAGLIYQLVHKAANPPVMGIGFAAVRDLVSFLKHGARDDAGNRNPLPGLKHALAYGASQTGRAIRELLYLGFNEDEETPGRPVLDGVNIHLAATRPFMNYRFAQPTRVADLQHEGLFYPTSAFPFAYEDQTDPFTGSTDGILRRCHLTGTCPRVMHTVTSTEYWQFKNSTVTTDPMGKTDGVTPDNVRIYFFAGGQHSATGAIVRPGVCEQPPNVLDYRPLLRALIVALDGWVTRGQAPPESRYPRISDGTLVAPDQVKWPPVPGVTFAGPVVNRHRIYDYGPMFVKGIITKVLPAVTPLEYGILVPQTDEDGNDKGGIRLPDLAVPTATRTGWAVRAHGGAAGELCNQDGSVMPFPLTRADREAKKDPRLSLEERYPNHGAYVRRVAVEATHLVKNRFLLTEDADRLVEAASESTVGRKK
jgi:hypothetical protein